MLKEIKSSVFREEKISFHSGLNVVIGDENAKNSIGKSNLLLIIDFVFGGNTYIEHSKDVIRELGEHEFYFCFEFDKEYKFKRVTSDSKNVYQCKDNYEVDDSKSIDEFTKFLKEKYGLMYADSKFRGMIGLYLRIWGKDNYDIKKPLKTYKNDAKEKDGIYNLIKLFNKYHEIKTITDKIKRDDEESKTITKMYNTNYATKITDPQYKKNEIQITKLLSQVEDIQNHVVKYLVNPEELLNPKVLELQKNKNELLDIQTRYENTLRRIERNLENQSNLSMTHLKKLEEFFPDSNIKKINEIEGFHNKIKKILASEIQQNKNDIQEKLDLVQQDIEVIDNKIEHLIENKNSSKEIMKQLYELTLELNDLKETNKTHKTKKQKLQDIRTTKEELEVTLETIVSEIKMLLNNQIQDINKTIYMSETSLVFNLESSKYSLTNPDDTGTGTSYMNLVMFDLAILNISKLPILAHDSILFKNVGNDIMENLIEYYNTFEKQIFIALDEHTKYKNVLGILEIQKVIKLDSKNTLYKKIWNDKK